MVSCEHGGYCAHLVVRLLLAVADAMPARLRLAVLPVGKMNRAAWTSLFAAKGDFARPTSRYGTRIWNGIAATALPSMSPVSTKTGPSG